MQKLQLKAQRWSNIIGYLPGVAAVFLSGSLAQGNGSKDSDIDFFIVAYPNSIWTARFFTNLVLKFSFNLAKPWRHQARICPNHFITTDCLEIVEQDAYSAHLFSHNQPLHDPLNIWVDFVETNSWVHEFDEAFPVLVKSEISKERVDPKNLVPKWVEGLLRWIQLKKIYTNKDFKKPGAKIVLKNTELRFHPDPKNQYWKSDKLVDLSKADRQADVKIETS